MKDVNKEGFLEEMGYMMDDKELVNFNAVMCLFVPGL